MGAIACAESYEILGRLKANGTIKVIGGLDVDVVVAKDMEERTRPYLCSCRDVFLALGAFWFLVATVISGLLFKVPRLANPGVGRAA